MTARNRAFLAFPSAAAALALGAFLWAGASPRVRALVVDARPLGGGQSGLSLTFSLQEDRFHQRQATPGGTLAVSLDTLDAHRDETLTLDHDGRATLLFPFDLERARGRHLTVRLAAAAIEGKERFELPPGELRLEPTASESTDAPHLQLSPGGRSGPYVLFAHASQWPPPVEQPFEVQWRAEGVAIDTCTIHSTSEDGVTVERLPGTVPHLLRTRVFAPPLARSLSVVVASPDGAESTWRGTLPNPPANVVLDAREADGQLLVRARSNVPEAHHRVELVDTRGLVADAELAITPTPDGFGEGSVQFTAMHPPAPVWLLVRDAGSADVKVLAPVAPADQALAVYEGRLKPRLDRWRAFDDFAEALRLAKRKRRIAMAGAIAASFVGSLLTLIGVLARHKGEDADEALSIDGTRSVVDTSRSRPLLILLVAVLFGMVALAASLSDL